MANDRACLVNMSGISRFLRRFAPHRLADDLGHGYILATGLALKHRPNPVAQFIRRGADVVVNQARISERGIARKGEVAVLRCLGGAVDANGNDREPITPGTTVQDDLIFFCRECPASSVCHATFLPRHMNYSDEGLPR